MLQKLTRVVATDQSGVGWVQLFHLYGGSVRKSTATGGFVKGAVKSIAFYPKYIRGKRYRPTRQGFVVRGLVMATRYSQRFYDNTRVWAFSNGVSLIKKRGVFKAKHAQGVLLRVVRRRRYWALFNDIV
jgi:ribosomal protein L14